MSLRPLRRAVADWSPGRGVATDPLHAVASAWAGIVGEHVAAHSAPLAVNGTTLLVATGSSAWSQQLQFLSIAILKGVREIPGGPPVERIAFRVGAQARKVRRREGTGPRTPGRRPGGSPVLEPAADLAAALERVRRRVQVVRESAKCTCSACGAPSGGPAEVCAPCGGLVERERFVALQRIVYMSPWLGLEQLREQLPDVKSAEYESARRHLLARWWLVLDRARRAGRLSRSGLERHVAGSYVLLQSRLPPNRVTPAVVRNLLGPELEALLWGPGPSGTPPEEPRRVKTPSLSKFPNR